MGFVRLFFSTLILSSCISSKKSLLKVCQEDEKNILNCNNKRISDGYNFDGRDDLLTLILSQNRLHDIPKLNDFDELEELFLDDNYIDVVYFGREFLRMGSLQHVTLSNNLIAVIGPSSFANLKYSALSILKLNDCNIREINENAFNGLTSLETLELKKNQLVKLEVKVFGSLNSITNINLESNDLDKIPFYYQAKKVTINVGKNRKLNCYCSSQREQIQSISYQGGISYKYDCDFESGNLKKIQLETSCIMEESESKYSSKHPSKSEVSLLNSDNTNVIVLSCSLGLTVVSVAVVAVILIVIRIRKNRFRRSFDRNPDYFVYISSTDELAVTEWFEKILRPNLMNIYESCNNHDTQKLQPIIQMKAKSTVLPEKFKFIIVVITDEYLKGKYKSVYEKEIYPLLDCKRRSFIFILMTSNDGQVMLELCPNIMPDNILLWNNSNEVIQSEFFKKLRMILTNVEDSFLDIDY